MRQTFFFIVLLFACFHMVGQPGSISGRVIANGRPLSAVSVLLEKTPFGEATNSNGEYNINPVPPGTYYMVVSMTGYEPVVRKLIVSNDRLAVKDIVLYERRDQLNEVVITGVTRATTIRKNPVPVSVVSRSDLNSNSNNNIIDAVLKKVPGLSAVTTGPNISKPFIRGLGYNRVLVMYDGMRQEGQQWGDEHGIEIDQYGIERVEVVKGPASLVYGSDALAGVINMIPAFSNPPDGKIHGDALADYRTNNGQVGVSAGMHFRKNDWKYSLRTTARAAHEYTNKVDGYVFGTAFREYHVTAMTGMEKDWGNINLSATIYDNQQEIPDGSRDSVSRRFTKQVSETGSDNIKLRPYVSHGELKSYDINALHQRIRHYRLYSNSNFVIGGSEIKALIGFQRNIRREFNHPTLPSQPGLFVQLNTFNYDIKYNLPRWKEFETAFGVNGMYQENKSREATDFPIPDYHLFDIGSFFFVKRTIGKLNISGGLRYDIRNTGWKDFYIGRNGATGFDKHVQLPDTIHARLQFPSFSHQYKGISGSIGATFGITKGLLLKANVSRGYRAPNITEIGSNGLDPGAHIVYLGNRSFLPEFSLQEDIGLMAYLKDADIVIELFNNDISNFIYQAKVYDANGQPLVIVPGNSTYQYRQSKARLYGAGITLNLHPQSMKWLAFNNGISFVEGINKDAGLIKRYGEDARYLPLIPPLEIRSELTASFVKQKGMLSRFFVKLGMEYAGAKNHVYKVDNTETSAPGYVLWNPGLGGGFRNRSSENAIQLFLQCDNVLNTAYQSNLNRLKYFEYYRSSPGGRLGIYNAGRNISMRMIVSF